MKRYKNRKSGIIVNVIGQNDAENKITVEFADGKNAGKQVNYKLASFTKSWKFLDEVQPTKEVNEPTKDEVKKSSTEKVDVIEKIEIMSSAIKSRGYSIKLYSGRIQNLNIKKEKNVTISISISFAPVINQDIVFWD